MSEPNKPLWEREAEERSVLKARIAELERELAEARRQLSTARADERQRCAKVLCEFCRDGDPREYAMHFYGEKWYPCRAAAIRNLE